MTADDTAATQAARQRIALAADLPLKEAQALYEAVSPFVGVVKVGLSLFVEHGPDAVRAFTRSGGRVFLDLKLHDIPNTVQLAAARAAQLGVSFLTVHAQGGEAMLRAAIVGAAEGAAAGGCTAPRLLAVTVLTSLSDPEVAALGYSQDASALAAHLAALAGRAGINGLVCSPREARRLQAQASGPLFLCTPGIRPAGAASGDQARAETPAFAIAEGSSLLVVGRPIHGAADPLAAAQAINAEVAAALSR